MVERGVALKRGERVGGLEQAGRANHGGRRGLYRATPNSVETLEALEERESDKYSAQPPAIGPPKVLDYWKRAGVQPAATLRS